MTQADVAYEFAWHGIKNDVRARETNALIIRTPHDLMRLGGPNLVKEKIMAVPKKKVSNSRKKIRLNSIKINMQNYIFCDSCSQFIKKHSFCTNCTSDSESIFSSENCSTNIVDYYNN